MKINRLKGFGEKTKIAPSRTRTHNVKTKKSIQANPSKAFINKTLADMSKKSHKAVILDGPDMKTTKALIKGGWSPNNIYNVNCSKDYYAIAKKHKKTYNCSMYEFLDERKNGKKQISLIYLDYMSTWGGNSVSRPQEDLLLLFYENLLIKGATLGITLSSRSKRDVEVFKHQDMGKVISYIHMLAHDANREVELVTGGVYNNAGSMFSLIFKVI